MKTQEISNQDDMIDSRDIIARIGQISTAPLGAAELEELVTLCNVEEQSTDYSSSWRRGVTLVRDSYFLEYAQYLAIKNGFDGKADWPVYCVDWDLAVSELQMDYTSVDFDGVEYWVQRNSTFVEGV